MKRLSLVAANAGCRPARWRSLWTTQSYSGVTRAAMILRHDEPLILELFGKYPLIPGMVRIKQDDAG